MKSQTMPANEMTQQPLFGAAVDDTSTGSQSKMMFLRSLALALCVLMLTICYAGAQQGSFEQPLWGTARVPAGIVPIIDGAPSAANEQPPTLPTLESPWYFNGPVMLGPQNLYLIFYGNWNGSPAPGILEDFVSSLYGSPYFNINTSYYDCTPTCSNIVNSVTLSRSIFDNYSHGNHLNNAEEDIVRYWINSGLLPKDPNGIYLVATSPDVTESSTLAGGSFCQQYCGWHFNGNINGTDIKYGFVGDPATQCPASSPGPKCSMQSLTPNGDEGGDAMVTILAHELDETVTDPDPPSGWSLPEVGDSCNHVGGDRWLDFGPTFSAPDGARANLILAGQYYLSQEIQVNDLTSTCAMSFAGAVSSMIDTRQRYVEAYYLGINEHVDESWWDGNWHVRDLTLAAGAPNAAPGSPVASQMDTVTNDPEVYFIGGDGHVYEMWFDTAWHTTDVTREAGGPNATVGGGLLSLVDASLNQPEVYYVAADHHVHELWWRGRWGDYDITGILGLNNVLAGKALTGDYDPLLNQVEVYYFGSDLGADQDINQLSGSPSFGGSQIWSHVDVTLKAHAPRAIVGYPIASQFDAITGNPEVYYVGIHDDIYELWQRNGTWYYVDVSASAGSPTPAFFSPLVVQVDHIRNRVEVHYVDGTQHVREVWWDGTWANHNLDVSVSSGAPTVAAAGSPLVNQIDTITQNPELYYIGVDRQPYELWFRGGSWHSAYVGATAFPAVP